jgi:ubiquinone/menaquinone biosynthesis C-methylase UbiE
VIERDEMSQVNLYRIEKDHIRENLNKYTRKAYNILPRIKNPHILDIGCGTGVPTIALAELSQGKVIGIDIDKLSLDLLKKKLMETEFDNQIDIIKGSMVTMDFPEKSFDIIWSEGSIFVIGFETGLKKWGRLLKPNGFLVIHDEMKDKDHKLELISKCGYMLIDQFDLSIDLWWREYFTPLEQLIHAFRNMYPDDADLDKVLNEDQIEIDSCKVNPTRVSSFYVILQKR